MAIFRKLSASLTATMESLVGQMQNHQALVEQTIREVSQAASAAKIHLRKVRNEAKQTRDKISELEDGIAKWTERAKASADGDKEVAINCLERKRELEQRIDSLRTRLVDLTSVEAKMTEDSIKIEKQLGELKTKRSQLVLKEKSAQVDSAVNGAFEARLADVQDVFDSWEVSLGQFESLPASDSLEEQFESAERRKLLEAELNQLRAESNK